MGGVGSNRDLSSFLEPTELEHMKAGNTGNGGNAPNSGNAANIKKALEED